jgi:hypothetical protein
MTSRERLLTAMRGGTPDRVPVGPFTMGRVSPDSPMGRELIRCTDPMIDVGSGGDPFLGSGAVVHREDTPDVTTVVYETPLGPLTRRIRRTAITAATVEFPFKSLEDVERYLSIPYEPPRVDLSAYRAWRDRIGDEGFVMIGIGNAVCVPADWFSPADFALAWAEAPDLMVKLVATASERLIAYVERLCAAGVDGFRIVGGEYVTVQLGHKAFAALIEPFDRPLIETMHRFGAIAYYHNHGRVMHFLKELASLGMDALDPLEAPPWGDVADLAEARKLAGDRLCFVGNLDDMEIINALPEAEVVEIARERLRQGGSTAFVLGGTASGTFTDQGARNFIAMARMAAGG